MNAVLNNKVFQKLAQQLTEILEDTTYTTIYQFSGMTAKQMDPSISQMR